MCSSLLVDADSVTADEKVGCPSMMETGAWISEEWGIQQNQSLGKT